ncbi:MAG: helix-turn-helix domain-containing protein [Spirochaetales bacterium]|nr:helix-turn-helix domain-containing protein [Spirochaetales bacterium]
MKSKSYKFGSKIRVIRERKGLTLKEVAGKAHVSESLISQIERDKVSPSIDTLMAIADVLELDVAYLFKDYKNSKKANVIKYEDQNTLQLDGVDYRQMAFHPKTQENPSIEVIRIDIPEGHEKGDLEYGHIGREVGIVLEGEGELRYGDKIYVLKGGDTVAYSSEVPHTIINTGEGPFKSIWILTPGRIFK